MIFSETTFGQFVHMATFCRDFTVPMVNGCITLRMADAVDLTTYLINIGTVMKRTFFILACKADPPPPTPPPPLHFFNGPSLTIKLYTSPNQFTGKLPLS